MRYNGNAHSINTKLDVLDAFDQLGDTAGGRTLQRMTRLPETLRVCAEGAHLRVPTREAPRRFSTSSTNGGEWARSSAAAAFHIASCKAQSNGKKCLRGETITSTSGERRMRRSKDWVMPLEMQKASDRLVGEYDVGKGAVTPSGGKRHAYAHRADAQRVAVHVCAHMGNHIGG